MLDICSTCTQFQFFKLLKLPHYAGNIITAGKRLRFLTLFKGRQKRTVLKFYLFTWNVETVIQVFALTILLSRTVTPFQYPCKNGDNCVFQVSCRGTCGSTSAPGSRRAPSITISNKPSATTSTSEPCPVSYLQHNARSVWPYIRN